MEAGPRILGHGALHMEKRPSPPAKEVGNGLEDLRVPGRKCSPPDRPENTEAAECPCSLIIFPSERWPRGCPHWMEINSTTQLSTLPDCVRSLVGFYHHQHFAWPDSSTNFMKRRIISDEERNIFTKIYQSEIRILHACFIFLWVSLRQPQGLVSHQNVVLLKSS